MENEVGTSDFVKEVIVEDVDNTIHAEVYPDLEYAKKKKVKDIRAELQKVIDGYNKGKPLYKQIQGLTVREEEFEKTPSQKIKRK